MSIGGNDIGFSDKIKACIYKDSDGSCFNTFEERAEVARPQFFNIEPYGPEDLTFTAAFGFHAFIKKKQDLPSFGFREPAVSRDLKAALEDLGPGIVYFAAQVF